MEFFTLKRDFLSDFESKMKQNTPTRKRRSKNQASEKLRNFVQIFLEFYLGLFCPTGIFNGRKEGREQYLPKPTGK